MDEYIGHEILVARVKVLQRERDALYAIALECFIELCAPLSEKVARQRLDLAVSRALGEEKE